MFNKICKMIEKVPITMLPVLFIKIVERCIREGVFTYGAMEKIIERVKLSIGLQKIEKDEIHFKWLTCGSCGEQFHVSAIRIHSRCGLRGCSGVLHKV